MGASVESTRAFRARFREEEVPRWYSAPLHVAFNFGVLLSVVGLCLAQLEAPKLPDFLVIPAILVAGSLTVYCVHRWLLHRPRPSALAYRIHSQQHHVFYTDEVVTPDERRDYFILFFPPTVVLGFVLTVTPALWFGFRALFGTNVAALAAATGTLYFVLYEVVHYASHVPESSVFLRIPYLRWMREHHRLHHRPELMHRKNFNIVLPLFDYVFGTVADGRR